MHYVLYHTKLAHISIMIGGKPPTPHLKSYFIINPVSNILGGDSAVLPNHITCPNCLYGYIHCHSSLHKCCLYIQNGNTDNATFAN